MIHLERQIGDTDMNEQSAAGAYDTGNKVIQYQLNQSQTIELYT